jgi:hypothetical protein
MSELDFVFGIACSGWLKVQCKGIMLVILAAQTIVAGTNKLLQKRKPAVKEGWLRQCISHASVFKFNLSSLFFLTFLLYGNVKLGSFNAITIFCFPFSF